MKILLLLSGALSLIVATPLSAAECTFATAIYKQPESKYVLRFQPLEKLYRFPATTNVFYVDSADEKDPLFGWVIWNQGESRPGGSLMKDCPEDGQTDEDFAECTAWKGVIYALTSEGAILLPGEKEPPPAKILLPDFGRALRYSNLNVENAPWDVFQFDSCGKDETK